MSYPPGGKESPRRGFGRSEIRDACSFSVSTPIFSQLTEYTQPPSGDAAGCGLQWPAMARPLETFSKVAAGLGVTRQAVYKWHKDGAPFHSAGALYDWLNRPFVRVLDDYTRPRWIAALAGVLPP